MTRKKASRTQRAATPALVVLNASDCDYGVETFSAAHSDEGHFGEHAAIELAQRDIQPQQIFKTLIVDLAAGQGPRRSLAVACVPVTHTLNVKKVAAAFGVSKVCMANPHDAEKSSGYIRGGISPLGQKHPLPTVIDSHALSHEWIYVSGGKRGLDIKLHPADLCTLTNGFFAEIFA